MPAARHRPVFRHLVLSGLLLVAAGAGAVSAQTSTVLDRSALRVCADPANLPFSNERRQGFENRIADLLGEKLGIPVVYTWFPQATGFVRQTLGAKKCDVIMGYAQGHELVLNTNHYYRSSYVMIFRDTPDLDGLKALDDPRLKSKKIGLVAGTPPATILALNGLMRNVVPFHLVVDRRHESPAEDMIAQLEKGDLDVAILWGPIGGYYARQSQAKFNVVPLTQSGRGPRMAFRITFGVRQGEVEWKRQLNDFISDNQDEINRILLEYGVPLLDEHDNPIQG